MSADFTSDGKLERRMRCSKEVTRGREGSKRNCGRAADIYA